MAKVLAEYRVLTHLHSEDDNEIRVYDYCGKPAPAEITKSIINHFKKVK